MGYGVRTQMGLGQMGLWLCRARSEVEKGITGAVLE
ncbi:hypothetical protein SMF913_12134 [Streptomyces malaysiensis]|uniref:Uncharacterized protein n=1 Tax=Streptomyces malaysiensis TaxID=92644 RepID=A0A2J7Z7F2_STRMQ|nr:hypothetical protein SMF913_12134 [Streptomyces malaysiensis]